MCVLTGLRTDQYDLIMMWWSSKPQSRIAQVLDSAAYCYVSIPHRSCYTTPLRSYHTSSSAHLGIPRLRPIISSYHTRSFVHLGLSCIRPSIMNYHPTNPPPSGFYCTMLSSNILLLLAAHKISAKVAQSFFSVASWHH